MDYTRATESDLEVIQDIFLYHPWDEAQKYAGERVRADLAFAFATVIDNVPPCLTRTRALNAIIDARMLANAAITHRGRY